MSKGTQNVLDKIDDIKVKFIRQMCIMTIMLVVLFLLVIFLGLKT